MSAIILTALLYYMMLLLCSAAIRPLKAQALLFSLGYLGVLLTLAIINLEYGLIEQKFASTFSFERYQGIQTRLNENFLFQAWVVYLGYLLTDAWEAAIGVNIAIFAALFLLVDRVRPIYCAVFLAPGIIHIALFALRDVIMALSIFCFCYFSLAQRKPNLLILGALMISFYMQRPELIALVGISYLAIHYREFSNAQKIILGSIALAGVVLVLPRLPVVLGLPAAPSIFALPQVLMDFFTARADRWTGADGAATSMLGGELSSVPFLLRYPLQVFAFFVSPLPVDFRGISSAVFLVDSLFFCVVFWKFYRVADRRHQIFFFVYVLSSAFFMANYGNLFRMRMPCYLIMLSGLLLHYQHRIPSEISRRTGTKKPYRSPLQNSG